MKKVGVLGQPGAYRRLKVKCPLKGISHRGCTACGKNRAYKIGSESLLGGEEPLAFLGLWLRKREEFPVRREHIAWKPTDNEVASYYATATWVSGRSAGSSTDAAKGSDV